MRTTWTTTMIISLAMHGLACGASQTVPRSAADAASPLALNRAATAAEVALAADGAPNWPKEMRRFGATQPAVVAIAEFENVRSAHALTFTWYAPDASVYVQSPTLAVAPTARSHRLATAWHEINLAGEKAATLPGVWRVAIQADGKTVTTLEFELEAAGESR